MSPRNYHSKFTSSNSDSWWNFSGGPWHFNPDYKKSKGESKIKLFFLKFKKDYNNTSDFK